LLKEWLSSLGGFAIGEKLGDKKAHASTVGKKNAL